MENASVRNRITFSLGTIGRDMVYAIVSMFLIVYLTEVLDLPDSTMWWITGIIFIARIFDALTDPLMGFIVDNTNTRWGKFKPWLTAGAVLSPVFTILLFSGFNLQGSAFIVVFAIFYFMWGISYTLHDISYWSMLPVLSVNQKEREKIGALARIFANIGLFFVVVAILPLTGLLGEKFGSPQIGFFIFSILISVFMAMGLCVTIFGVKETGVIINKKQGTPIRELFGIIYKNDQLFITAVSMSLFMIGYMTTTSFGVYFFKYVYGDEGMYSAFAAILGISQLTALSVFPLFSKKFNRKTLYTGAIVSIVTGYIIFFTAPVTTMIFIGIAGVLIFFGQSFIQLLMLMFLADSVDYGHWKLGKRNDSISFSIQPLINKMGGAVGSGIVAAVVIISGINTASDATDIAPEGILLMKAAMLILPMLCIIVSYIIYRMKFKIDAKFHAQILSDLRGRGDLAKEEG
ncbi:MAG: glycoside-pentoside-hexuronide (GPH):cation symporter [Treponema sp.]|jgi:melibiose permease/lactose/raffinose/galactose permease|nr:glycoside-pentoside-hexuronide (GPH):cation symporter [Treponema sp.]